MHIIGFNPFYASEKIIGKQVFYIVFSIFFYYGIKFNGYEASQAIQGVRPPRLKNTRSTWNPVFRLDIFMTSAAIRPVF
jgi:hypothetical protein